MSIWDCQNTVSNRQFSVSLWYSHRASWIQAHHSFRKHQISYRQMRSGGPMSTIWTKNNRFRRRFRKFLLGRLSNLRWSAFAFLADVGWLPPPPPPYLSPLPSINLVDVCIYHILSLKINKNIKKQFDAAAVVDQDARTTAIFSIIELQRQSIKHTMPCSTGIRLRCLRLISCDTFCCSSWAVAVFLFACCLFTVGPTVLCVRFCCCADVVVCVPLYFAATNIHILHMLY